MFSLEYHVDTPINTVFNAKSMRNYLKIFHFLWRLKRVEHTLSSAWEQWRGASREFSNIPEIQQDIQYAQLTIQRMVHFIYQLQHYVLFEASLFIISLSQANSSFVGIGVLLGKVRDIDGQER